AAFPLNSEKDTVSLADVPVYPSRCQGVLAGSAAGARKVARARDSFAKPGLRVFKPCATKRVIEEVKAAIDSPVCSRSTVVEIEHLFVKQFRRRTGAEPKMFAGI